MVRRAEPKNRIRMLVDHDWPVPGKRAWLSFRAGREYSLTMTQAEQMRGLYEVMPGDRNGNR